MPVTFYSHPTGVGHPPPYREHLAREYTGRTLVISQSKAIIHSLKDEFEDAFIVDGHRSVRDFIYAQRPDMVLATAQEFKQPKAKPIEQQTFSRTVFVHSPAAIDPSAHLFRLVKLYYAHKTRGHDLNIFVDPVWLFLKPALIWGMANLAQLQIQGRPFPKLRDWLNSVAVHKLVKTRQRTLVDQWGPIASSRRDYAEGIVQQLFGEQFALPSNETSLSPTQPSGDS